MNELIVSRMQLLHYSASLLLQRVLSVGETDATLMKNENIGSKLVLPASGRGAQAEVVFFAVALAKTYLVELSGGVKANPANKHAKTNSGRNIDVLIGVGEATQTIDIRQVLRQFVVFAKTGIAANRGVVGKRCNCTGIVFAVGADS